ncbi:MAG: T9SS type A sorting domain-containing protein [Bacteroidota bacterium]
MMKHLYLFFALALLSCLCLPLNGQEFPYELSVSDLEYGSLTNADTFNVGIWDDPELMIPLGFDFEFFGQTTNTFYNPGFVGPILTPTKSLSNVPLLNAFLHDLIDRGTGTGSSASPILYKTVMLAGQTVLIVEWQNAGFYDEIVGSGVNESFINMQLWFYDSGIIELCFGPSNIVADNDVFDGLPGPFIGMTQNFDISTGFTSNWYLSGDPANPTVSFNDFFSAEVPGSLDSHPAPNTLYRFAPITVGTNEERSLPAVVQLFPNPASDYLRVNISREDVSGPLQLRVFNVVGELIQSRRLPPAAEDQLELDIRNLPAGTYQLQLTNGQQQLSQTFVKQ